MSQNQRILLYFVLPTLAPLLFPPDWLASLVMSSGSLSITGLILLLLVVGLFIFLGYMLMRGRSTALTLSIFLQGLNVIVRLMMFFPHVYEQGKFSPLYVVFSILSIGLSMYLLMRLDKVDVRSTMVK